MNDIYHVMNHIEEGIIILDNSFKIIFCNNYMEDILGVECRDVLSKSIYNVIKKLDRSYFRKLIQLVLKKGYNMFFSAAMHKEMIKDNRHLNLKLSTLEHSGQVMILMEFIDVTNQFLRIKQLKSYVKQLHSLNDKLMDREKTIKKLAYYDELTGVANRSLFYEFGDRFINNAKIDHKTLGVMFVDVDNFKYINDNYGHKIGDKMLIEVAKTLKKCTRCEDLVARFGGDEFLVLLPNIRTYENYKHIKRRILAEDIGINVGDKYISSTLSIGFSIYPNQAKNIDELIGTADQDMYNKKQKYRKKKQ